MSSSADILREEFNKDLSTISSSSDIENLHIKYLGRNGKINKLFQEMSKLTTEEKKSFGKDINTLKKKVEIDIEEKKNKLLKLQENAINIDPTLPGSNYSTGSLHLVTYAIEEISRIFGRLGFIRMTYPEVEWEYFSFEALNMPSTHPARDDFETFFIDIPPGDGKQEGRMVLTPHTSSGQIREMLRIKHPPIRMIKIAKK